MSISRPSVWEEFAVVGVVGIAAALELPVASFFPAPVVVRIWLLALCLVEGL